jgi:hypothetical protein
MGEFPMPAFRSTSSIMSIGILVTRKSALVDLLTS